MTSATETRLSDEVLDERWHMATTKGQQFGTAMMPSETSSDAMRRLVGGLRELAMRMTHDGDSGGSLYATVESEAIEWIEARLKRYARDVEAAEARRTA
jgi:hypothetical protein